MGSSRRAPARPYLDNDLGGMDELDPSEHGVSIIDLVGTDTSPVNLLITGKLAAASPPDRSVGLIPSADGTS